MKIEVNVDKRILLVVIGMLLIGAGVYASVNTSLPYHDASQVALSSGDSVQDYVNKMSTFTPGDIWVFKTGLIRDVSQYDWKKVVEFSMGQGGSIRTSFRLRNNGGGGDVYARVYVNGTAVGTQRKTNKNTWQGPYIEDININTGDKLQLYIKGGSTSSFGVDYVEIDDFKLGSAQALPFIQYSNYSASAYK